MKGIVLAGGTGSRLWPITKAVSKQLLPVYDKPMIYYPISTLMLAGIRNILIITTPQDKNAFQALLGDGSEFGVVFQYQTQPQPRGLAEAFIIGAEFLEGDSCLMILGDNIFYGAGLGADLKRNLPDYGGEIFTYNVSNPTNYGVIELDTLGNPLSVEEKPIHPKSNLAITGLYYFDRNVVEVAKKVIPSARGELEITSIIEHYLKSGNLSVRQLSRGTAWLDTGNPISLHDAGTFVRVIEERTGLKIACLEEISYTNGWISKIELLAIGAKSRNPLDLDYLRKISE